MMATDWTEIHYTWQTNTMENTPHNPPPGGQKKKNPRQGKTGNVCMRNVTVGRIHTTTVPVEKQ